MATYRLKQRMLSPLTGLDSQIGFTLRNRSGARVIMSGAEMTGVHVLRGEPRPRRGFYHIGGAGLMRDESLIRALGETVERYTQFVSQIKYRGALQWATPADMAKRAEPCLDPGLLAVYAPRQYAVKGFPFVAFEADRALSWVLAESFGDDTMTWVPAQIMLVGYTLRHSEREQRLGLAVTTGGAAHVTADMALRNGLLELIQIDTAMGHWYGHGRARRILPSARTRAIDAIAQRLYGRTPIVPQFHVLENPDLPGFIVACALVNQEAGLPAIAVGLGADLGLEESMYKALLEAAGVAQLAKITLSDMIMGGAKRAPSQINPDTILDLDSNVAFYALPGNAPRVFDKLNPDITISADALPDDGPATAREAVAFMIGGILDAGKRLYYLDLTTDDAAALGFSAARTWSPDLITLCMPSAPAAMHPRFEAYGGFRYAGPHPYP